MRNERLRQARKDAGFSSEQKFAEFLGIERSRYHSWEIGNAAPSTEYLAKLCRALNVTADYLIGVTDTPMGYFINDPAKLAGKDVELVKKSGTNQFTDDEVAAVRAMLEQNRHCCISCRSFFAHGCGLYVPAGATCRRCPLERGSAKGRKRRYVQHR